MFHSKERLRIGRRSLFLTVHPDRSRRSERSRRICGCSESSLGTITQQSFPNRRQNKSAQPSTIQGMSELLTYPEADRIVASYALQRLQTPPALERIPLEQAAGRVLAEPVLADQDQPPSRALHAMDLPAAQPKPWRTNSCPLPAQLTQAKYPRAPCRPRLSGRS